MRQRQLATVISEMFAPLICAAIVPPLIAALTTAPWWRGLLLGLLVTLLTGVVPFALLRNRVRRGRYADHHLMRREDRPGFLMLVVVLVLVALALVRLLGGSQSSQVFIVLMLGCVAVGAVVSRWWKLSMHALVLAASLAVLISLFPRLWPLAAVLPAVAWARYALGAHTVAQLLAGAVIGATLGITAAWAAG